MLDRKQKYLQIALNNTLGEAKEIIDQLPQDQRIILEAGTPLIKRYGMGGISQIKKWWQKRTLVSPYIVADLKCMDRGETEVKIAKGAGASAVVALGQAPLETLNAFIKACQELQLDSMLDMMNVDFPLNVLRQLKTPPRVVILHRGVDEEDFNREKEIPFHEIGRIKNEYDVLLAIAGGDSFQEVQRAIFNDADIVVVWKEFYRTTSQTSQLALEFLKEIR